MTGRDTFGWFHPLHPRNMIVLAHAGFALGCFNRPNLNELLRAYEPFGNMNVWYVGLWALAAVLLLSPRASLLMMAAQLVSAVVLFTIAGLLTLGVGVLPTAITLAGLGFSSLLLFRRALGEWLDLQDWWRDARETPPAWLTRRRWFQRLRERHRDRHG